MNELMKTTSSLGVILSYLGEGVELGRRYPANKIIMVSNDYL